jgi:hypothetical protein
MSFVHPNVPMFSPSFAPGGTIHVGPLLSFCLDKVRFRLRSLGMGGSQVLIPKGSHKVAGGKER